MKIWLEQIGPNDIFAGGKSQSHTEKLFTRIGRFFNCYISNFVKSKFFFWAVTAQKIYVYRNCWWLGSNHGPQMVKSESSANYHITSVRGQP